MTSILDSSVYFRVAILEGGRESLEGAAERRASAGSVEMCFQ